MAYKPRALAIDLASAGTAQQISSSTLIVHRADFSVPNANTGVMYIGGSDIDSTHRRTLEKGETFSMFNVDLSTVYFDGANTSDDLQVVYYLPA